MANIIKELNGIKEKNNAEIYNILKKNIPNTSKLFSNK